MLMLLFEGAEGPLISALTNRVTHSHLEVPNKHDTRAKTQDLATIFPRSRLKGLNQHRYSPRILVFEISVTAFCRDSRRVDSIPKSLLTRALINMVTPIKCRTKSTTASKEAKDQVQGAAHNSKGPLTSALTNMITWSYCFTQRDT
jgi:hypothetical protein